MHVAEVQKLSLKMRTNVRPIHPSVCSGTLLWAGPRGLTPKRPPGNHLSEVNVQSAIPHFVLVRRDQTLPDMHVCSSLKRPIATCCSGPLAYFSSANARGRPLMPGVSLRSYSASLQGPDGLPICSSVWDGASGAIILAAL